MNHHPRTAVTAIEDPRRALARLASILLIGAALLLSLATVSRAAEPASWTIDPVHSTVAFSIMHIAAPVHARFDDFQGTVAFDPDHPEKTRISVEIKTAGVNTGNAKRDEHLRSAEFFNVESFPVMTFTSDQVTRQEGDVYTAKGSLTIRDVTEPVDLKFTFLGVKPHPMQKGVNVAGFKAETVVDRLKFNVGDGHYFKGGMIGKDVEVLIYVEALSKP